MKTYEDERIIFSYPEDFKIVRAKKKWGQYDLEKKLEKKKNIVFIIHFVSDREIVADIKRDIRNCFVDDFDKGEYFGDIIFGDKEGIGHVVTLNDFNNNFIQKRYRYLFPIETGGLYVEVIGDRSFEINDYKEILESIKVK